MLLDLLHIKHHRPGEEKGSYAGYDTTSLGFRIQIHEPWAAALGAPDGWLERVRFMINGVMSGEVILDFKIIELLRGSAGY